MDGSSTELGERSWLRSKATKSGSYSTSQRQSQQSVNSDTSAASNTELTSSAQSNFGLKRQLGLPGAVSLIFGCIVGSGIFISPIGVLEGTQSVGLSLVTWAACGVISMCGSMGLVELGTMITKSGGDYSYIGAAYGSIPAYLYAWCSILFIRPASVSIMCLTCAEYLLAAFFDINCGRPPELLRKLVAVSVIVTVAAINIYSVKLADKVSVVFSSSKLIAMGVIVVGGAVRIGQGYTEYLENAFEGTSVTVSALAVGFYNGMWAYDGWNNLNYATEEVINPTHTLPWAIFIAIPLVTIFYVLVNVAYFTVLSPEQILASPAVAVTWAENFIPSVSWLFPLFVALSTFGSAHATLFTGGRMCYAAAREGHMVSVLSMVHVKNFTPLTSLLFTALIAILMIIPADIGSLLNFFSFTAWLFYGAVAAALLVLRFKWKDVKRPYKVPLIFPIITLLVSIYLVIAPLVQDPAIEYLFVAVSIFAGLVFYFPFVQFKKKLFVIDYITKWTQLLMNVAPPVGKPPP